MFECLYVCMNARMYEYVCAYMNVCICVSALGLRVRLVSLSVYAMIIPFVSTLLIYY